VRSSFALVASLALAVSGCGGDDADEVDAATADAAIDALAVDAGPDAPPAFVPPTALSETGLYSDLANLVIAADALEYAPRWQLWSDEAVKRRWIYLPPGSHIDTTDMNFWHFPQGTKLWKEFARGGRRIETRFMQKIGTGDAWTDWYFVSFQWSLDGTGDPLPVPDGVVDDAGPNDIPGRSDCRKCHADTRIPSVVIGFSALQLDFAATGLDLHQLVVDGWLTAPPAGGDATTPYFPLPAGDALTRDAMGYLHANCGNCHNSLSDVRDTVGLNLRQDVDNLASWAGTLPFTSTVDVMNQTGATGATAIVEPGRPAASALYYRLTTTGGQRMPPVGRELVDPTGSEAVRAWIASLPPTP